jgi:hypothetical protein
MKNYNSFVNEEVGIRKIKSIIGTHTEFEIYFHKDLDGVTSALAMKYFIETYYKLKLIDAHQIQYGGLEFAIKYGKPGTLKVLVDFAHGKPMFQIQSDHHDKQTGAADTQATYFKPSRSNVEIISGEISYSEVFTPGDIELIKTVDSANFLKYGISPEDVQNSIFKFDTQLTGEKNRFMMGFIVNRLLLAYKNKRITVKSLDGKRDHINKNILECMVLDCTPSLYSIFNNLRHYITTARVSDRAGVLASPEEIKTNLQNYISKMKDYRFIDDPESGDVIEYDPQNKKHQQLISYRGAKVSKGVHFDEKYGIIIQYGGGSMIKPGSYDRYVPFKNFPEAKFMCMVWPLGLIQVSCNPFKEKELKNINLGEIAKEIIAPHQIVLNKIFITLDSIKKEFETSQDWKKMQKEEGPDYMGVGFRFSDLEAFYSDCIHKNGEEILVPVVEIDFEHTGDQYQDIKVQITFEDQKYVFSINDTQNIKDFVMSAIGGNVDNWSDFISEIDLGVKIGSKSQMGQIDGAKNNIVKLLQSEKTIVSKKDKIVVCKSFDTTELKTAMNNTYDKLTREQMSVLKLYSISCWELITRNSGGHPSITNLQGWNFLKYNKEAMKIGYQTEKYTDVMKKVARDFVDNLKDKIDKMRSGQDIQYKTAGVEFLGQDTNENFTYHLVDKGGKTSQVSKDEFVKAGHKRGMKSQNGLTIDPSAKKIIAKFENFNRY